METLIPLTSGCTEHKLKECSQEDVTGLALRCHGNIPDVKGKEDMRRPSTATDPFSHLLLFNVTVLGRFSPTTEFKDTYPSFLSLDSFFLSPYHNCSLVSYSFSYIFSVFVPRL